MSMKHVNLIILHTARYAVCLLIGLIGYIFGLCQPSQGQKPLPNQAVHQELSEFSYSSQDSPLMEENVPALFNAALWDKYNQLLLQPPLFNDPDFDWYDQVNEAFPCYVVSYHLKVGSYVVGWIDPLFPVSKSYLVDRDG